MDISSSRSLNNENNLTMVEVSNSTKDTFADFHPRSFSENFSSNQKDELLVSFKNVQKKQGVYGRLWNSFKNYFGMKNGSDDIERILKEEKAGNITKEDAQKAVEKYEKRQSTASNFIMNFTSSSLVMNVISLGSVAKSILTYIEPKKGGTFVKTVLNRIVSATSKKGVMIALSLLTGIISRVALGAFEKSSNEVKEDYSSKDLLKDAAVGAVIGGIGVAGKVAALGLEDKFYLKFLKFASINAISTGGSSLANSLIMKSAVFLPENIREEMKERLRIKEENQK